MSSETWPPLSARIALGTGSAPASVAMVLQAIFVVNKAGSLIFYRKFVDSPPVVSQNDQLHLASTFHGMQLLVQQLAPVPSRHGFGIETLETASYVLQAFRPETGVQFFVTADPRSEKLAEFLKDVYVLYADYVMKNPFYEIDMPIKCDQWEAFLRAAVDRYNRSPGSA